MSDPGPPRDPDSSAGADHSGGSGGSEPDRLYVLSRLLGDREDDADAPLDLITLVVSRESPQPDTPPEQAAVLRMCRSPLSVAEISAYLRLPFSVVTVILTELRAAGRVEVRAPVPAALLPDISLIEAVMHGLQKL